MKELHWTEKLMRISELFKVLGISSSEKNIISHYHSFDIVEGQKVYKSKYVLNVHVIVTDVKSDQLTGGKELFEKNTKNWTSVIRLEKYCLKINTVSYEEAVSYFYKKLSKNYIIIWKKPYKPNSVVYTMHDYYYHPMVHLCCNINGYFRSMFSAEKKIVFHKFTRIGVIVSRRRRN